MESNVIVLPADFIARIKQLLLRTISPRLRRGIHFSDLWQEANEMRPSSNIMVVWTKHEFTMYRRIRSGEILGLCWYEKGRDLSFSIEIRGGEKNAVPRIFIQDITEDVRSLLRAVKDYIDSLNQKEAQKSVSQ